MSTYCYLRVSTDTQDVDTQKIGIEEFCQKKGWEIDDWIRDEGVSGAKDPSKRKLGGLLKRCQSGDHLVFSEISRIGRKLVIILDVIKLCSEKGVKIYTVKDRYVLEDTIQSKVLVTVMGLAAEIERDLLRQRTKEGLRRAVANGKTLGRPRGKTSGSYKIDKAKLVDIESCLRLGFTISKIAKRLKCHKVTVYRFLTFHGWRIVDNKWLNADGEVVSNARCSGHRFHKAGVHTYEQEAMDGMGLHPDEAEVQAVSWDGRTGDNGESAVGSAVEQSTAVNIEISGGDGNET